MDTQYYFNAKEAAVFCGLAPITIYRATRQYREGDKIEGLRYIKKGHRTIRISKPDLIAWMEGSDVHEEAAANV